MQRRRYFAGVLDGYPDLAELQTTTVLRLRPIGQDLPEQKQDHQGHDEGREEKSNLPTPEPTSLMAPHFFEDERIPAPPLAGPPIVPIHVILVHTNHPDAGLSQYRIFLSSTDLRCGDEHVANVVPKLPERKDRAAMPQDLAAWLSELLEEIYVVDYFDAALAAESYHLGSIEVPIPRT